MVFDLVMTKSDILVSFEWLFELHAVVNRRAMVNSAGPLKFTQSPTVNCGFNSYTTNSIKCHHKAIWRSDRSNHVDNIAGVEDNGLDNELVGDVDVDEAEKQLDSMHCKLNNTTTC